MRSDVSDPVIPAVLEWNDGVPYSPRFGDVYSSREGAAAEKHYVFIEGNSLTQRFAAMQRAEIFAIAETGFGTGLNFLLTLQSWQGRGHENGWLFYLSVEKHPFTKADLEALYTTWLPPQLKPEAEHLLKRWPPLLPGFHWLVFPQQRLTLLLMFEPVEKALAELEASVDCWFLDGFAPAKNPEMWSAALFKAMQRLSRPGASFATYSAALPIREGLEEAGFLWRKEKGFGHKKHMLKGQMPGVVAPQRLCRNKISVIGGGLAGCSAAHALARYGLEVHLYEREGVLASKASGNPAAILKPYLAKEWSAQTLLYNQAFYHAMALARQCGLFHEVGAVQLAVEPPRHRSLAVPEFHAQELSAEEASQKLGQRVVLPGTYQPEAGWMHPASFCQALMAVCPVEQRMHSHVQILHNECTLVANAYEAQLFPQLKALPLVPMRGQITVFESFAPLQCIANYGGYALPHGNQITLGSTYDRRDMESAVRPEDDEKNISEYNKYFINNPAPKKPLYSRVSWRTTTPSKRPIVGKISENLFISLGLGSRGALLAPYLAEQAASEMLGLPHPMQKSLKQLLLQDVIKISGQRGQHRQ